MFSIAHSPINPDALKEQLEHASCGGFCNFEGWVRNHNDNKSVDYLTYSSYEELALSQGNRIIEHALKTFDIQAAICVHRVGTLRIGDMAVWVGVSAAHRNAAFEACRYIIDTVKADVPIWKQEFYTDLSHAQGSQWLANPESSNK